METNEIKRIAKEYQTLKGLRKLLLADMREVDPDSRDMADLRRRLIDITIGKINPIRIIDNFFIGKEYNEETKKGGR